MIIASASQVSVMDKIGYISINKKNLIPNKQFFIDSIWLWISALIMIYWLRQPILDFFPFVESLSVPYRILIYVLIGYYLKELLVIKIGKREVV